MAINKTNILLFNELVKVYDAAGTTLIAENVPCSIRQHLDGMRDKVADICVTFATRAAVSAAWPAGLRIEWRGLPQFVGYAFQYYNAGTQTSIYASPFNNPNLEPLTSSALNGAVPQRRYTALITQAGINPPVAYVAENTTGRTFTWSKQGIGYYQCSLDPRFEQPNSMTSNQMMSKFVTLTSPLSDSSKKLSISSYFVVEIDNPSVGIGLQLAVLNGSNMGVDLQGFFYIQIILFQ